MLKKANKCHKNSGVKTNSYIDKPIMVNSYKCEMLMLHFLMLG